MDGLYDSGQHGEGPVSDCCGVGAAGASVSHLRNAFAAGILWSALC